MNANMIFDHELINSFEMMNLMVNDEPDCDPEIAAHYRERENAVSATMSANW